MGFAQVTKFLMDWKLPILGVVAAAAIGGAWYMGLFNGLMGPSFKSLAAEGQALAPKMRPGAAPPAEFSAWVKKVQAFKGKEKAQLLGLAKQLQARMRPPKKPVQKKPAPKSEGMAWYWWALIVLLVLAAIGGAVYYFVLAKPADEELDGDVEADGKDGNADKADAREI